LKRLTSILLAVSFAAVVATAASASPDPGTYAATITGATPALLNGNWRMTFGGGSYRITRNGKEAIGGFTSIRGARITLEDWFGPYACRGAQQKGTYRWAISGRKLTFAVVKDSCAGRRTVLVRAFKKLS
jgi:hypothetical protein